MAAKLTELQVKNAKPGKVKYTKAAGHGLTLLVMPDGSKYWRQRYRFGGKARMIAVGKPYPHTTLKQAQAKAAEFRALIEAGADPADRRRAEKLVERERVASTFGEAAEAWHRFRSQAWDEKTAEQARNYLNKDMLPKLRSRPLDAITPPELGRSTWRRKRANGSRRFIATRVRTDGRPLTLRETSPPLLSPHQRNSITRICKSRNYQAFSGRSIPMTVPNW
jgi:hypothetical protein